MQDDGTGCCRLVCSIVKHCRRWFNFLYDCRSAFYVVDVQLVRLLPTEG